MSERGPEHKEQVRQSFDRQARTLLRMPIASHRENVAPMIDLAKPAPADELLDAGCWVGFVTMAFAPYVARAIGVDLSPQMIDSARKEAQDRGIRNVEFRIGDAEHLPFPDDSFDIVASRFTFHHCEDPAKVLAEMGRVGRPTVRIVIYDILSSSNPEKAGFHNRIEKERDPSHARMLPDREWRSLAKEGGLQVRSRITVLMKRDFESWMDVVSASPDHRLRVRKLMEKAAKGNSAGLGVRLRDESIIFTHTCVVWLLTRR